MKKWKLICAFVLVFALLGSSTTALAVEGDPAFVVSQVEVQPGEGVDVTIRLVNNPGIASAKLEVIFGETLTLTGVTYNADLGGMTMPPVALTSPVTLNWLDFQKNFKGDGLYATLHFTVADGAGAGCYPIEVTYDADNVYNIAEENIPFQIVNGAITVAGAGDSQPQPEAPEDPVTPEPPEEEAPADAPQEEMPVDTPPPAQEVPEEPEAVEEPPAVEEEPPVVDLPQDEGDDNPELWLVIPLLVLCLAVVGAILYLRSKKKQ